MNAASAAEKAGKKPTGRHRSAARLAAVQALYEMDMAGAAADPVLREFLLSRWTDTENGGEDIGGLEMGGLAEPDGELLFALVHGVGRRRAELDGLIAPALSAKWTMERLETVLKAVLRAGAFELLVLTNVPPRVVISEYVDVAHAFFSGGEPGFVNSVLDHLARQLRAREMAAKEDGDEG